MAAAAAKAAAASKKAETAAQSAAKKAQEKEDAKAKSGALKVKMKLLPVLAGLEKVLFLDAVSTEIYSYSIAFYL